MTKNYGSKWPPWYFGVSNTSANLNHNKPYVHNIKINVEKPGFYLGITDNMTEVIPIESAEQLLARSGKIQA